MNRWRDEMARAELRQKNRRDTTLRVVVVTAPRITRQMQLRAQRQQS